MNGNIISKIPNDGKKITIMGVDMWLPKAPPLDQIQGAHLPKEDQKWYRTPLPDIKVSEIEIFSGERYSPHQIIEWDTVRREEMIKQTGLDPWELDKKGNPIEIPGIDYDPAYVFDVLQDFRDQELDRCNIYEGGFWFMNNGEPIFMTPYHYFYCNWWKLDSGYPDWRWTDAMRFYYWQYCFEDDDSLGMIEVSKRGDGKTYRGTAIMYLTTVFKKKCQSGIQSKNGDDAEALFKIKLVEPYKDLPDFLIPINANPSDPKESLRFFAPSKAGRSSHIHRLKQRMALRSSIDYRASTENAYDGQTIRGVLFRDEEGKTVEADVNKRHSITRDCVYRDGKTRGKIYSTTTVEEMDKGAEKFQPLWKDSDPSKRTVLNQTISGLLKFFLPAYMTEYFDDYGFPDVQKAKSRQGAIRKSLEGNPAALLKYTIQYPWDEHELFMAAGLDCQYNIIVLRDRERLTKDDKFNLIRVGNFKFINDIIGENVYWEEDINGRWNVWWFFKDPNDSNRVSKTYRNGKDLWLPLNSDMLCGGFDPTKMKKDESSRRSNAGGAILMDENNIFKGKVEHGDIEIYPEFPNFIADYVWQPDNPEQAYIDFLAGCWYYGCPFLIETNLGIDNVLEKNNCDLFIKERPIITYTNEKQIKTGDNQGLPASEWTNNKLLNTKQVWMFNNAHKLLNPRIITDSINYNPKFRTRYDLEVATQNAIIGMTSKQKIDNIELNIAEIFNLR